MFNNLLDIDLAPALPYTTVEPDEITHSEGRREPILPWPSKLPLELALGAETPEEVLLRYNISEETYLQWATMPAFRRALAEAAKEVRENGLSFRVLCQGIAADFLPVLDQKLHAQDVKFGEKLDAFKHLTKLAGLEPKEVKDDNRSANLVQININI